MNMTRSLALVLATACATPPDALVPTQADIDALTDRIEMLERRDAEVRTIFALEDMGCMTAAVIYREQFESFLAYGNNRERTFALCEALKVDVETAPHCGSVLDLCNVSLCQLDAPSTSAPHDCGGHGLTWDQSLLRIPAIATITDLQDRDIKNQVGRSR